MSLRLSEYSHKGNIDAAVAQYFCDMGGDTRLVLMDDDDGAVLAGEIHLHLVDAHDPHLSASQRLPAHGHDLASLILHADIHGVWVNIGFRIIYNELKLKAPLVSDTE